MSDNLPAVPDPTPRAEVATIDTDSWVDVMRPLIALADRIYDTEFVPKGLRGSAPATAAAMLYGREVGLPPMTALNMTHVVEGKPGLSAEGMRALVLASGHAIEFVETTGAICTMRGRRRGADNWTTLSWTIDMARSAGLTGKNNWKSYPRDLLVARCTTSLCRMIFPDVIHGFRSVEELEDMSESDGTAAPGGSDQGSSTRVTRKRAAKKTAAAAPRQLTAADAPPGMPPLPGEPGYDDETPAGGEPDDGAADRAAVSGEDTEDSSPAGSDAPGSASEDEDAGAPAPVAAGPGAQAGEGGESTPDAAAGDDPSSPEEPADVVDADVVEEVAGESDTADQATAEATGSRPAPSTPPRPISRARQRMLMARFGEFGMSDDREERLLVCSTILGREVESTNNLSNAEASTILDTLANVGDREALNRLLDTIDEARAMKARAESGEDES